MKVYSLYYLEVKGTDRRYVGQTCNPERRLKQHKQKLKSCMHHSLYLQRYFDKHGLSEDDVSMVIVATFGDKSVCDKEEEGLISESYGNLFNVSMKARGGDLVSYHPERDRICEVHRENYFKRMEHGFIPPGTKWGEDNPNYRHGRQTQEALQNAYCCVCNSVKVARVGAMCNACLREFQSKTRAGEGNSFFGKHHSEETKRLLSEKGKGRFSGADHPLSKKIVAEGVVYVCCKECAKAYGISGGLVTYRLKSKKWDFHEYDEELHKTLPHYGEVVRREATSDNAQIVFLIDNTDIDGYKPEDFKIEGYKSHSFVKLPVSV